MGATGSVASVRVPRLLQLLLDAGASVRLVSTDRARHFLTREQEVPPVIEKRRHHYTDADEWGDANGNDTASSSSTVWTKLSDPVLHIELRKWADVFVIAPASANVLAKVANGLCDDLLTCVARAWPMTASVPDNSNGDGDDNKDQSRNNGDAVRDGIEEHPHLLQNNNGVVVFSYRNPTLKPKSKPLLLAPAMNTAMWEHPVTKQHVNQVTSFGANVVVLNPVAKRLACGDVGVGAMMQVDNIVRAVVAAAASTTR